MPDSEAIEYVLWWLKVARKEIAQSPGDTLHAFTSINYSGGKKGWNAWIDQIYFKPSALEEWFLHTEVRKVLLIALARTIAKARLAEPESFRAAVAIAGVYRLSALIAPYDPLLAIRTKATLERLCRAKLRTSLFDQAETGFGMLTGASFSIDY